MLNLKTQSKQTKQKQSYRYNGEQFVDAWLAAVHGVTKSRTRLSDFTFTFHPHR